MKLNWNFPGGGGVQNKNLLWGEYGYFLELHISRVLLIEKWFWLFVMTHNPCNTSPLVLDSACP